MIEQKAEMRVFVTVHRWAFARLGLDPERAAAWLWYAARALWWLFGVSLAGSMFAGHLGVPKEVGEPFSKALPWCFFPALGLSVYVALLQSVDLVKLDADVPLQKGVGAGLSHADRVALLQTESELLQSRFDKYDSSSSCVAG